MNSLLLGANSPSQSAGSAALGLRKVLITGLSLLGTACGSGSSVGIQPGIPSGPLGRLLVANTRGNDVVQVDPNTGALLGTFIPPETGGLFSPDTMILGPDANDDGIPDLYISSGNQPADSPEQGASAILVFDGLTGALIGPLVADDPTTDADETGGLFRPYGIAFGPDSLLYVSSFLSDQILRYDGATGAFFDVFASGDQLPGGLNGPNGLLFGPDGSLYVTTQGSVAVDGEADFSFGLPSQILRYDIATGSSTVFATPDPSPESFGFVSLLGLAIGPDGLLYTSDFANDIRIYDLATGSQVGEALSTNYTGTDPSSNFVGSLSFGLNGILYAVGFDNSDGGNPIGAVLRYDTTVGQPFPSIGSTGPIFVEPTAVLNRPIGVLFY